MERILVLYEKNGVVVHVCATVSVTCTCLISLSGMYSGCTTILVLSGNQAFNDLPLISNFARISMQACFCYIVLLSCSFSNHIHVMLRKKNYFDTSENIY